MNHIDSDQVVAGPRFIYGTAWKEEAAKDCVLAALQAGFRSIDTANQRKHYHEVGVGDALLHAYESSKLTRGDLFLQTKFTYQQGQDHRLPYDENADLATQVQQSFDSSLKHLHTHYIDSYVLHGPRLRSGLAEQDVEVWRQMESIQVAGGIRLLGVSNVNLQQLQELYDIAVVKPTFVQNRCFAVTGWDRDIREFCTEKDIMYQGFSLLTANRQTTSRSEFITIRV